MTTNSRYNFSQMTRAITLLKSHLNNAVSSSQFSSSPVEPYLLSACASESATYHHLFIKLYKGYVKFLKRWSLTCCPHVPQNLPNIIISFQNLHVQSNKFCTTMKLPARYRDTLTEPSDKPKLIIQCSKLDYVENVACILGMKNLVK
ncbi:Uncharacterized protein Rs2_37036 [Raphanus sativus]|nr:Uncharacterized protein Rs2_37036 [Raphanus sativus]